MVDFHAVLRQTSYQASSIHSRRRFSSMINPYDRTPTMSPTPPPPPPPPQENKLSIRTARSNRLLADLWLMSAATFRRLGKIEQAKGAIQEAEVRDEDNPAVWVQVYSNPCRLLRLTSYSSAWPLSCCPRTKPSRDSGFAKSASYITR